MYQTVSLIYNKKGEGSSTLACECSRFSYLFVTREVSQERLRRKICPESGHPGALIGRHRSYIVSAYCFQMINKRQKAMKVKSKLGRKRDEFTSFRIYSSLETASVFRS